MQVICRAARQLRGACKDRVDRYTLRPTPARARRSVRRAAAVAGSSVDETSGVGASTSRISSRAGDCAPASAVVDRRLAHPRRQRRQPRGQRARPACPGRETTTKFARSRTSRIAAPRRNFRERVGAGDEENLRRREAASCSRVERVGRVTTAPSRRARRRWRQQVRDAGHASAAIAKRWNGDADGWTARCGGMPEGRTSTRSSASASRAASGRVDVPE